MRFAYILIFAISLILRIWFNLFCSGSGTAFACDAAEYFRHAQNIDLTCKTLFSQPGALIACANVLLGQSHQDDLTLVKQTFLPLQSMSIAGPIFPIFLLACYKVCGQSLSMQLWAIPLIAQSILSAIASVLIASIGTMCFKKETGIAAGLIATFYPGFIINSGRLYSESFACFLLCLTVWIVTSYLIQNRRHYMWGYLLGITLFCLQTTRSIMCILSIVIITSFVIASIFNSQNKKVICKYWLAILVAFFICSVPWLSVQKLAFGKASLIVDRVGSYNLFVGTDTNSLGWLSVPYPDLSGIETKKYSTIVDHAIKQSPERFIKLMLDKPGRLFKLPWNDFRTNIGPLRPAFQAYFHQLIFVLAGIGFLLTLCRFHKEHTQTHILSIAIIAFAFLLHLTYLAFITVPRYALTAMPEIILFSAVAIENILLALKKKETAITSYNLVFIVLLLIFIPHLDLFISLSIFPDDNISAPNIVICINIILKFLLLVLSALIFWKFLTQTIRLTNYKLPILYTIISLLIISPFYCFPLRAYGRTFEWKTDMYKNGSHCTSVVFPSKDQCEFLKTTDAYLAINIENGSTLPTDWDIAINKVRINGPFIPSMSLSQDLTLIHSNQNNLCIEQESIVKSLCDAAAITPLDLRQWYLIPISASQWQTLIEKGAGQNNPSLKSNSTCLNMVVQKRANGNAAIFGVYCNNPRFALIPSLFGFSWEKAFYGVENEDGLSDPAYDQKIHITNAKSRYLPDIKLFIPKQPELSKDRNSVRFVSCPTLTLKDSQQKISNFNGKECQFSFKASSIFSPNHKNNFCLIHLFGYIEGCDNRDISITPQLCFTPKASAPNNPILFTSPWIPKTVKKSDDDNHMKFDVCFPVRIDAFPTALQNIDVSVSASDIRKSVSVHSSNSKINRTPNIHCNLQVFQMPNLISGVQYEIL